jgi:hypothetical protein
MMFVNLGHFEETGIGTGRTRGFYLRRTVEKDKQEGH